MPNKQFIHESEKLILKEKGWSNRAVAPRLGVTYAHLNRVLNGHRQSVRLLAAIHKLPNKKEVAK